MQQHIEIPTPFKVMLLDDHVMFNESLRELLTKMLPGCEINCFANVAKAKTELSLNDYRFLLSDIMMPNEDTSGFIVFCRKKYPNLIIIMLSSIIDTRVIKEYFGMGINGYISKVVGSYELKQAMEQTYKGIKYISNDLGGRLATSFSSEKNSGLTTKELEVLKMVIEGHSIKKTAELMNVSAFTIHTHRRNIMAKLDLHSVAELVRYAFENKLHY